MRKHTSPYLALAVICGSTFTVSLASLAINIALPSLVVDLRATTTDLQWIVDAYSLVLAAFVLAFGSLSDRYGRKGALLSGHVIFGAGAIGASTADTARALIGWQAVLGLGAALIFPTTLSLLSNVFTERGARARAIGVWGATTGLGAASGPILSGWLLQSHSWRSVYVALACFAALALVVSALTLTTSRDPTTPRIDVVGLVLSTLGIGSLVYTIIAAPARGWLDPLTLLGFAAAVVAIAAFVAWELHCPEPMLDVALFRNPRFTAASAAVTFAYFALFGFTFLVTQYFQFVRGYSPLSTGVRILPVAVSIAVGSVVGVLLAVRIGNKAVVTAGLISFTGAFAWISTINAATSYQVLALQMIPLGLGIGLTSAPATEAIMGVVTAAKAGIGSAMNDATRELGGTLGVAVLGSVYVSLYSGRLAAALGNGPLPDSARHLATDSIGAAQTVAQRLAELGGPAAAQELTRHATTAFLAGMSAACLVAAGVTAFGALFTAVFLPSRPQQPPSTGAPTDANLSDTATIADPV